MEDEPFIAIFVTDALKGAGASVNSADTLKQALVLVETDGLSAAILDHRLPDGDSQQICSRLKEREIPFVMFSGYAAIGGACDGASHLAKPATEEQVVEAIERLIGARARPC
ncbi:MAG: response regulator [Hyphomicrobium sp.]